MKVASGTGAEASATARIIGGSTRDVWITLDKDPGFGPVSWKESITTWAVVSATAEEAAWAAAAYRHDAQFIGSENTRRIYEERARMAEAAGAAGGRVSLVKRGA